MPITRRAALQAAALSAAAGGLPSLAHESAETQVRPPVDARNRLFIFSKASYYRHPEIPALNGFLVELLARHGFHADVSETPSDISPAILKGYGGLLFNNANHLGESLDENQRKAIIDWYHKGGAIVGIHAALVEHNTWPWFVELAGCDFNSDSEFLKAKLMVDRSAKNDPTVKGEPAEFYYEADWTNYDRAVTGLPGVKVLLRVDESTFEPVRAYFKTRGGKPMGKDHPVSWTRELEGSRFFFTALGHDVRSLDTPFGRKHLIEGIRWAMRKDPT